MSEFLKMDIFFAVTTMVVFFFGALGMVALYYVVRILRNFDRVAKNIADESDNVKKDVALLRAKAHEEGMRIGHLLDFFLGMRERQRAKRGKRADTAE